MKTLLRITVALAALAALSGCCTTSPRMEKANDWRAGTDYSPYRSIPTVLLCDDCKY